MDCRGATILAKTGGFVELAQSLHYLWQEGDIHEILPYFCHFSCCVSG